MPTPTEFRVVDVLRAPHDGWLLRLRVASGEPPRARTLKGRVLVARGPGGEERRLRVKGFPLFAGRRPDERLEREGRVDVHAEELDADGPRSEPAIDGRWAVRTE